MPICKPPEGSRAYYDPERGIIHEYMDKSKVPPEQRMARPVLPVGKPSATTQELKQINAD